VEPAVKLVPSSAYSTLGELLEVEGDPSYLDFYKVQRETREGLKSSLKAIFSECSQANWDGYDAAPISIASFREAENFLTLIPFNLPSPYIVPQPDGGIAFEWSGQGSRTFIASFNGQGVIYLSWYRGSPDSAGSAREKLSEEIPPYLLHFIQELFEESI